jgi:hypothetical protein
MTVELDATLILWGDNLAPDEVTAMVGQHPTRAERKGVARTYSSGKIGVSRTGMWQLSTLGLVPGRQISDHLRFIVDNFRDILPALRETGAVDQMRLSVIVTVDEAQPGISSWEDEIPPNLLAAVANLGASLSVVVSYPSKA